MGRESACKKLSSSNITYEAAARPDLRIGTRPQPCFAPPCSPCVSGSRAGIWYPSRGRNGLTPGHDPATSGLFCRLRNPERIIGIFLNRGFTAAYLTNTKIARENRPEVQFQSENQGQNLRNRPEVNWRRQKAPAGIPGRGLQAGYAHSTLASTPIPTRLPWARGPRLPCS